MNISIITVHMDDFDGLERTFQSLKSLLTRSWVRWVVIDGGSRVSTDDHKACLENIRSAAAFFSSEPDSGIYDAMNKGSREANGDYVLYLNAGDELHPDFDPGVLSNLVADTRPDMIWGHCQQRYQNGNIIQIKTRSPAWAWYGMPVYHPAIFFRREALGDSPYDTRYRIAADYDLVCRLLSNGATVKQLDSPVCIFHRGGVSDVCSDKSLNEENKVRLTYYRIPAIAGGAVKSFKRLNSRLANIPWFRSIWRRWI